MRASYSRCPTSGCIPKECDADMLHRFRIVSQEEFSQIEHDAETRAEVSQPLDGDALAQLASLKEKLEGEKK